MTTRPYHHGGLRQALLARAEETLRESGAAGLSLRELAREIGVSHAAPRRHFNDKAALLDALAVEGFGRMLAVLQAASTRQDDGFAERLVRVTLAYVRFAIDNAALLELMFTHKHDEGASEELRVAAMATFDGMLRMVAEGQAAGELRPGDPEQVGRVIFAQMQGITALANTGMITHDELEELTRESVRVLAIGLAAPEKTGGRGQATPPLA